MSKFIKTATGIFSLLAIAWLVEGTVVATGQQMPLLSQFFACLFSAMLFGLLAFTFRDWS